MHIGAFEGHKKTNLMRLSVKQRNGTRKQNSQINIRPIIQNTTCLDSSLVESPGDAVVHSSDHLPKIWNQSWTTNSSYWKSWKNMKSSPSENWQRFWDSVWASWILFLKTRGLVKVGKFADNEQKMQCRHILTPHGIKEKIQVTVAFIHRKEA